MVRNIAPGRSGTYVRLIQGFRLAVCPASCGAGAEGEATKRGAMMSTVASQVGMVVVRFNDGRTLKGITHDFGANKESFHLFEWGDESAEAIAVPVGALKAIFFVKSYEGNKGHVEQKTFDGVNVQARKIVVTFKDGEVLAGTTVGYNPKKQGFFVIPVDPDTNNTRVYVVNESVAKVEWA